MVHAHDADRFSSEVFARPIFIKSFSLLTHHHMNSTYNLYSQSTNLPHTQQKQRLTISEDFMVSSQAHFVNQKSQHTRQSMMHRHINTEPHDDIGNYDQLYSFSFAWEGLL